MRKDREQVAGAFGQVLRLQRTRAGVSQEDLALRAGVDRTFVSKTERGLNQPALATVLLLAKALNVSAASLVAEMEAVIGGD